MKKVNGADSWRMPDELWWQIEPLLPARKVHRFGGHNPRVPDRQAMEAILYVLRTGSQWNSLDATGICSCASAYRRFREWSAAGVFERFWQRGLKEYDEFKGIDWSWLSMDGSTTKAPLGGKKPGRIRPIARKAASSAAYSPMPVASRLRSRSRQRTGTT